MDAARFAQEAADPSGRHGCFFLDVIPPHDFDMDGLVLDLLAAARGGDMHTFDAVCSALGAPVCFAALGQGRRYWQSEDRYSSHVNGANALLSHATNNAAATVKLMRKAAYKSIRGALRLAGFEGDVQAHRQ